jgi:DASH complex subunit DAM1
LYQRIRSRWSDPLLEEDSRLAEEAALKAASAVPPSLPDSEADRTTYTENAEFETTYATNATARSTSTSVAKNSSIGISKKKGKPKLTAKEKKERSVSADPMTHYFCHSGRVSQAVH